MPGCRGVRKIYSQFYYSIQASLRVLTDPVVRSLVENQQIWVSERGISWMGLQAYTRKRRIHNWCTPPVEYSHAWSSAGRLSLVSIDRSDSSMDNLNHRRSSTDL